MVIFGAGASYDSVDIALNPQMKDAIQYRPPLAKDLFEPRDRFGRAIDEFNDVAPLVNRLRRAARDELVLEDVLLELEQEARSYPERHRQLLAIRCYLRRIVSDCTTTWVKRSHGATNYVELIDIVERWRSSTGKPVTYVTFNYDVMLDSALAGRFRCGLSHPDEYIGHPSFNLFKPHGSVDWGRLVGIPLNASESEHKIRDWLFAKAGSYEFLDDIVKMGHDDFRHSASGNVYGVVPALAIPMKNKRSFECPQTHITALQKAIRNTTSLVTIGWRGLEAHFGELWLSRNDFYDSLIVSGSQDAGQDTISNLEAFGMIGDRSTIHPGGFGTVLDSGALEKFLERVAS